ncbi:MAG: bifunctional 5,10-methylenetetrahydrofolate dehydrogenase/5,10-methenyltetrahydrofolate cyclohydrolase, partial [Bacilli bacterium]
MIFDGKKLRDEILLEIKNKIIKENIDATLAIILVGDNDASKIYIKNKVNACNEVGIKVKTFELDENTSELEVINLIKELSDNKDITGIILQSPVPSQINFDTCCTFINSDKDVDGFTKDNICDLYLNSERMIPCTVKGIIKIFEKNNINLTGSNIVVVGRGNIVGKPLFHALLNRDATVTLCHSKTKNLKNITMNADIVVSATGVPHLIKKDMVKKGVIIIDVGISRLNGKITGDVDFVNV